MFQISLLWLILASLWHSRLWASTLKIQPTMVFELTFSHLTLMVLPYLTVLLLPMRAVCLILPVMDIRDKIEIATSRKYPTNKK